MQRLTAALSNQFHQLLVIQGIKHPFIELSWNTVECRLIPVKNGNRITLSGTDCRHWILFQYTDTCTGVRQNDTGHNTPLRLFNRSSDYTLKDCLTSLFDVNVRRHSSVVLMPRQRHGRRHSVVSYDTGVKPPKPGVSRY